MTEPSIDTFKIGCDRMGKYVAGESTFIMNGDGWRCLVQLDIEARDERSVRSKFNYIIGELNNLGVDFVEKSDSEPPEG